MYARQRGATFIGMVTILAILGLGLYACIRLTPLYMEYFGVVRALEQTAKELADATTASELRTSLERRWVVEDIQSVRPKDIEIKREGNGFTMRAAYRAEVPFIANVSLAVYFDKAVTTRQ
jgi:hypothetical protein